MLKKITCNLYFGIKVEMAVLIDKKEQKLRIKCPLSSLIPLTDFWLIQSYGTYIHCFTLLTANIRDQKPFNTDLLQDSLLHMMFF